MTVEPGTPGGRIIEMSVYRRYFDLIAAGRKTTEIRVNDPSRRHIKPGGLIRFTCHGDTVLTRVTQVNRYVDFEGMLHREDPTSINPLATPERQLADIREIYPPERESLGVLAIGIELVDPPGGA